MKATISTWKTRAVMAQMIVVNLQLTPHVKTSLRRSSSVSSSNRPRGRPKSNASQPPREMALSSAAIKASRGNQVTNSASLGQVPHNRSSTEPYSNHSYLRAKKQKFSIKASRTASILSSTVTNTAIQGSNYWPNKLTRKSVNSRRSSTWFSKMVGLQVWLRSSATVSRDWLTLLAGSNSKSLCVEVCSS